MEEHTEHEAAASPPRPNGTRRILLLIPVALLLCAAAFFGPHLLQARDNPLVQHFIANAPQLREMMDLTLSQIENQAASLDAAALLASPGGYDGRYVVASGLISADESNLVAQNTAVNCFNDNGSYRAYVLDDGLVVVDVSGEGPEQLPEGAAMKAYGKVIVARMADIFELPWVGPDLKREFGTSAMSTEVVFLVARGVQVGSQPQN